MSRLYGGPQYAKQIKTYDFLIRHTLTQLKVLEVIENN